MACPIPQGGHKKDLISTGYIRILFTITKHKFKELEVIVKFYEYFIVSGLLHLPYLSSNHKLQFNPVNLSASNYQFFRYVCLHDNRWYRSLFRQPLFSHSPTTQRSFHHVLTLTLIPNPISNPNPNPNRILHRSVETVHRTNRTQRINRP